MAQKHRKSTNEEIELAFKPEKKQKFHLVKLVCGCMSIEIKQPRDQVLVCGKCGKKTLLVWQYKPKLVYDS